MPQIDIYDLNNFDIRNFPEVLDILNAEIKNGRTVELKNEGKNGKVNLVAVDTARKVLTKKPSKQ